MNDKNNHEQLKPFEKGDTRINLKGRPKGSRNLKTIIKEQMHTVIKYQNPFTHEGEEMTPIDALTLNIWYKALVKDDYKAQTLLLEYLKNYDLETNESNPENHTEEELQEQLRYYSNISWPDEYGFTFDAFLKNLDRIKTIIGEDAKYQDSSKSKEELMRESENWINEDA